MKKILMILILFVQISIAQVSQARGVWLSRDILEVGPEKIEETCYKLANANFNRIFVNVFYLGATIYPSTVVEEAGGSRQLSRFWGRDPLAETIEIAHRWNLEVIGWFEYGLMSYYSGSDTSNSGPILTAHPDWEAIDHNGLHYQKNDWGVFHWLDAAHPEVKQFMEDLFAEIAAKYPELDGIETDRIRYPSSDFSYSKISRQRYQQQTGGTDPLQIYPGHSEWGQWVKWRESQINQIAKRIYQAVKAIQPDILVSAAVAPPYMLLSGSKLQRWDVWSDSGYVDALEPMLYLTDSDFLNQFELTKQKTNDNVLLFPGIDFSTESSFNFQASYALNNQAQGITIWYWQDLTDQVLENLKAGLFRQKTGLPHRDFMIDNDHPDYFTCDGSWQQQAGGFNGSVLLSSDPTAEARFRAPIKLSGHYAVLARWPAMEGLTNKALFEIQFNNRLHAFEVNQQTDQNHWNLLMADSIPFGSRIQIKLKNLSTGLLAADAIRVLKRRPLQIIDYFFEDSIRLNLHFNQSLDSTSALNPANYHFTPSLNLLNISFVQKNLTKLQLLTEPFISDQTYFLTIENVKDVTGLPLNRVEIAVQDKANQYNIILDNSDQTFIVNGTWQTHPDSCATGKDWLFIPAKNTKAFAQWWTNLPKDGYYQVAASIPCTELSLDNNAQYTILHAYGSLTLQKNQAAARGNWLNLGTYYFKSSKTVSVKLNPSTSNGVIVADAIRIKRTFNPTSLPDNPAALPTDFNLGINYPNPFNLQTVIPVWLKKKTRVELHVFDATGRKVRTLFKGHMQAGRNLIKFRAEHLSSGIYFCVAQFDGKFKQYAKMILLK